MDRAIAGSVPGESEHKTTSGVVAKLMEYLIRLAEGVTFVKFAPPLFTYDNRDIHPSWFRENGDEV